MELKFLTKLLPFLKSRWWLWLAAVIIAFIIGFGAQYVLKQKDSPAEELSEKVIEEITGLNIDFSK